MQGPQLGFSRIAPVPAREIVQGASRPDATPQKSFGLREATIHTRPNGNSEHPQPSFSAGQSLALTAGQAGKPAWVPPPSGKRQAMPSCALRSARSIEREESSAD